MKRKKDVIVGTKRTLYPAAGVQSDVEALLQKFVDTNSIRYEDFARLWRQSNFSLIHCGRAGLREKREFVEEAFKIVLKFALPPYSLQVRVGAVYLLYGIYHTQRLSSRVKVRIPLSCWQEVDALHDEVRSNKHLDIDYVMRRLKHDGAFEFVAYPSHLTLEHLYNCDEEPASSESNATAEISWQGSSSETGQNQQQEQQVLDEDSLGQLSAVHDKYHLLKCQLNQLRGGEAGAPSSSLDLIQSDIVETLLKINEEVIHLPSTSVLSPDRDNTANWDVAGDHSSVSDVISARDRANRIQEIKKRASSARASSRSGALRYISSDPTTSDNFPVTSPVLKEKAPSSAKGKAKKRRKASSSSESDSVANSSDASSDYDVTMRSPAKKIELPSRKSKREARKKLNQSAATADEEPSDASIDDDVDDDDMEYDFGSEVAKAASSKRSNRRLSSLLKGDDSLKRKISSKSSTPRRNKASKSAQRDVKSKSSADEIDHVATAGDGTKEGNSSQEQTPPTVDAKFEKASSQIETSEEESTKPLVELEKGTFVALAPGAKKERERPLVAKVVDFDAEEIEVTWYLGGYSTKWSQSAAG